MATMENLIKNWSKATIQNILNKYPRIVFTHVPKCAGTAVSDSLCKSIYPNSIFSTSLIDSIKQENSSLIKELLQTDLMRTREILLCEKLISDYKLFITGHCYANPQVVENFIDKWNFITVLRDPVERYVSEYVYNRYKKHEWLKIDMDIREYIESDVGIYNAYTLTRYFSGYSATQAYESDIRTVVTAAINNLSNFKSVGFLDQLSTWESGLNKSFNCRIKTRKTNKTPKKQAYENIMNDKSLIEQINSLCKYDIELYNRASEKFRV